MYITKYMMLKIGKEIKQFGRFLHTVRYLHRTILKVVENITMIPGCSKIPLGTKCSVQFGTFLYENCKTFCLANVRILSDILFYGKKRCIASKFKLILRIFYLWLIENAGHLSSTTTGKCAQLSRKGPLIKKNLSITFFL